MQHAQQRLSNDLCSVFVEREAQKPSAERSDSSKGWNAGAEMADAWLNRRQAIWVSPGVVFAEVGMDGFDGQFQLDRNGRTVLLREGEGHAVEMERAIRGLLGLAPRLTTRDPPDDADLSRIMHAWNVLRPRVAALSAAKIHVVADKTHATLLRVMEDVGAPKIMKISHTGRETCSSN